MKELIELIEVHIPSSDLRPTSLYSLKKCFGNMNAVTTLQFCSNCQQELEKNAQETLAKRKKRSYVIIVSFLLNITLQKNFQVQ